MKKAVWLKPEAVAQIEFLEWTGADRLRHSKFVRLRRGQGRATRRQGASWRGLNNFLLSRDTVAKSAKTTPANCSRIHHRNEFRKELTSPNASN